MKYLDVLLREISKPNLDVLDIFIKLLNNYLKTPETRSYLLFNPHRPHTDLVINFLQTMESELKKQSLTPSKSNADDSDAKLETKITPSRSINLIEAIRAFNKIFENQVVNQDPELTKMLSVFFTFFDHYKAYLNREIFVDVKDDKPTQAELEIPKNVLEIEFNKFCNQEFIYKTIKDNLSTQMSEIYQGLECLTLNLQHFSEAQQKKLLDTAISNLERMTKAHDERDIYSYVLNLNQLINCSDQFKNSEQFKKSKDGFLNDLLNNLGLLKNLTEKTNHKKAIAFSILLAKNFLSLKEDQRELFFNYLISNLHQFENKEKLCSSILEIIPHISLGQQKKLISKLFEIYSDNDRLYPWFDKEILTDVLEACILNYKKINNDDKKIDNDALKEFREEIEKYKLLLIPAYNEYTADLFKPDGSCDLLQVSYVKGRFNILRLFNLINPELTDQQKASFFAALKKPLDKLFIDTGAGFGNIVYLMKLIETAHQMFPLFSSTQRKELVEILTKIGCNFRIEKNEKYHELVHQIFMSVKDKNEQDQLFQSYYSELAKAYLSPKGGSLIHDLPLNFQFIPEEFKAPVFEKLKKTGNPFIDLVFPYISTIKDKMYVINDVVCASPEVFESMSIDERLITFMKVKASLYIPSYNQYQFEHRKPLEDESRKLIRNRNRMVIVGVIKQATMRDTIENALSDKLPPPIINIIHDMSK